MHGDGARPGDPEHEAGNSGSPREVEPARLSRRVLDFPRRTRLLLTVAGLMGVALVAVESLVAGQPGAVRIDKILHFAGYAILAAVFALALRARFLAPALVGLAAMGLAIEFLQTQTGRTFDLRDAYADAKGVAVGGALGLLVRGVYVLVLARTDKLRDLTGRTRPSAIDPPPGSG